VGSGAQQPVMQYSKLPQSLKLFGSHARTPAGQLGPSAAEHDAGSAVLPTHSSHSSQAF
jgi:hypothetical protein